MVEDVYARTGLDHLTIDLDTEDKAMSACRAGVLPTTLVIGPDGNLPGGPAEWDSDAALAFARDFIQVSPR